MTVFDSMAGTVTPLAVSGDLMPQDLMLIRVLRGREDRLRAKRVLGGRDLVSPDETGAVRCQVDAFFHKTSSTYLSLLPNMTTKKY